MAEKVSKARITLKHDTAANWGLVPNFIPKMAEAIVYEPDSEHSEARIKIGDGTTPISTLPFVVKPLTNDEIDAIISP